MIFNVLHKKIDDQVKIICFFDFFDKLTKNKKFFDKKIKILLYFT